jgi:hypothetical protein
MASPNLLQGVGWRHLQTIQESAVSDVGDILKPDPVDKAADLLHKLAGPIFEEFGAMLADKVRVYRVKNLVSTMQTTERILRDAGLPAKTVPPRLLLPIIENSSIEDNEMLRDMWAGLLGTASQQTDSVSPSFVETLKQLTPDDARHLEQLHAETLLYRKKSWLTSGMPLPPWVFSNSWGEPPGVSSDTFERLGLIRREYEVKTIRSENGEIDDQDSDIVYRFVFTEYAIGFLDACHGPGRTTPPRKSN